MNINGVTVLQQLRLHILKIDEEGQRFLVNHQLKISSHREEKAEIRRNTITDGSDFTRAGHYMGDIFSGSHYKP